jgi:hypothetical protein
MLLGRHILAFQGRRDAEGLDRSGYILLSRIRVEGPISIGELSEALRLDASTLNRQTAALLAAPTPSSRCAGWRYAPTSSPIMVGNGRSWWSPSRSTCCAASWAPASSTPAKPCPRPRCAAWHATPKSSPPLLGGDGQVLDLGKSRRLFTGPLRRALVIRDGGCAFPGCDRPPRWCDGHHMQAASLGGPTSVDNGVLLCGFHHRLIHQGEWEVRLGRDRLPEFIPPAYLDPLRPPQRNTYHRRP